MDDPANASTPASSDPNSSETDAMSYQDMEALVDILLENLRRELLIEFEREGRS